MLSMSSPGFTRWVVTKDFVGGYRGRGLEGLIGSLASTNAPPAPKHSHAASAQRLAREPPAIWHRLDKGVDASLITSDPCRRARGGLLARLRSVKAAVFADFVPAVI